MFLPLVIILDKVEGFKIEDKVGKKLKKEILTRRRRGRWNTSLSGDPKKVIEIIDNRMAPQDANCCHKTTKSKDIKWKTFRIQK